MLRKVQRTRKEQIEKKISSKIMGGEPTLKENRNYSNNAQGRNSKNSVGSKGNSASNTSTNVSSPEESFRVRETKKTMFHYANDMLDEMKSKQDRYWPKDSLENHGISPNVRAKMVSKIF